jgi:hypothetical protein
MISQQFSIIKNNMAVMPKALISTFVYQITVLVLTCITASAFASTKSSPAPLEGQLSFYFKTHNESDEQLINRLKAHSVFERIKQFSVQNFKLNTDINYRFQHPHYSYKDTPSKTVQVTTESETYNFDIDISFSFLHQLDQGLQLKYPEQREIQERIYAAAIEKLLWFELGRALISQYSLSIAGKEEFALDNFSTLMLLNLNTLNTDYILDAIEAFLLIDQSISFISEQSYQSEVELDEQRYRKSVCLILGKDLNLQLQENQEPYQQLISQLSWDQKRLEQCKKHYLEKLSRWVNALDSHLKNGSQLKSWLVSK